MNASMLHHLRPAILRAGIGLLLALPMLTMAIQHMRSASAAADTAIKQATAITLSMHAVKADLPTTLARINQYQTLQQRHVVGSEQRAAWIDRLHELQRTYGVFKLEYRFQPRHPLTTHPALMHSPMQLHMHLLHEGDLVELFSTLEDTGSAHLRLRTCTLQRLDATTDDTLAPALQADCLLDWITIAGGIDHS